MADREEPLILTPDRRLRVFISSTLDLTEERAAARRSVEALRLTPVMFEAGARPHPPRALYRAYVEQSDVFVAIYAQRYGWTAPGMAVSGLEDELDLSEGKPRLVYVRADVEREPRLAAMLERVSTAGLSYRPFTSTRELGSLLRDDLMLLLSERFHPRHPVPRPGARARLPAPRTVILGRQAEVTAIQQQLGRGGVRLLTLVGPGGVGKTRLAIEGARRLEPRFPDGAYFVSLEALRQPQLVADTIAAALEVAPSDASPALGAAADAIGSRRVLLVLDNFEQVIAGAEAVAALLEACEHLKILVTSRSPLRLRGEQEMAITPLALPSERGEVAGGGSPAVQLFLAAARAVRPAFEVDDRSMAAVVEICRQLDGLPLAIELAAAMARMFAPEVILDRLREDLTGVGVGRRDMPQRHRTLRSTIAWSYELLDDATRQAFAQLSVFRGGFTLESAAEICDVAGDLLSAVAVLAEQSLLRVDLQREGGGRFSMLGTIRRFASERLDDDPAGLDVRARHARAFLALLEAVGEAGGRDRARLDVLEAELDDVRQALEWSLATGHPDQAAHAIWASWWFWWTRGHLREAKVWADRCADAAGSSPAGRARARAARGMFAIWSGEYELAVVAFGEAADTARQLGDGRTLGYADIGLGLVAGMTTSVPEGSAAIRGGIATLEARGDDEGAMTGLVALGWLQAITREFEEGDEVIREALRRAQRLGADVELGVAESALAQRRLHGGDVTGALDLLAPSLDHLAAARHLASTILTLEVIAEVALGTGRPEATAVILGSTSAIRASMGTRVPPQAAARLDAMRRGAREQAPRFTAAFRRGATMGFDGAVEHGRSVLTALAGSAPRSEAPDRAPAARGARGARG